MFVRVCMGAFVVFVVVVASSSSFFFFFWRGVDHLTKPTNQRMYPSCHVTAWTLELNDQPMYVPPVM